MFKNLELIIMSLCWLVVTYFLVMRIRDLNKRIVKVEEFFDVVKDGLLTKDKIAFSPSAPPETETINHAPEDIGFVFNILPERGDFCERETSFAIHEIKEPADSSQHDEEEEEEEVSVESPKKPVPVVDTEKDLKRILREKGLSTRGTMDDLKKRLIASL